MDPPDLVIFVAIDPRTRAAQENLARAIREMAQEDPTFRVETARRTGQTLLYGTGEAHLEAIVDRMKRDFGLEAAIGNPQVAYRETIRHTAEYDYTHENARTRLKVEPVSGEGCRFVNEIEGGHIPPEFIPAIEKGVAEALEGGLKGFPMMDIKVTLLDGAHHDVDSSEMAFRICSSICAREACQKATPVLLEPVMAVEVVVPDKYMGAVYGDLISRRGQLEGTGMQSRMQLVKASVPIGEMFGYAAELRSRTQGRGSFTMRFARYEPLTGGPDTDDDDRRAPVPTPRKPAPKGNQSRAALPEPDDDA